MYSRVTIYTSISIHDKWRYKSDYSLIQNVPKSTKVLSETNETIHLKSTNSLPKQNVTFATKIVNYFPPKIQPYLKLLRMDKPIGEIDILYDKKHY